MLRRTRSRPGSRAREPGARPYFEYDGHTLRTAFTVPENRLQEFHELARETLDWRLAEYLQRSTLPEEPRPSRADGPERWRHYMRRDMPFLFGLQFSQAVWNSGFVKQGGSLFLLVTLEKGDLPGGFQYEDRFLAPDLFQWQSQNRTTRDSNHGQDLSRHKERGLAVHLFVRRTKKIQGKPTPFVYCGPIEFVDWENDAPITIRWRLPEPVPPMLRPALSVPG